MGNGVKKIVNKASNLPHNVLIACTANSEKIGQWHDNGNSNQRWRLTLVN
ncbi:RICIN domain-containing protein [Clostridium thermarum]